MKATSTGLDPTVMVLITEFNLVSASLTATSNTIKLTNTTIDVGQFTIANTVISGGTGGPFSGEWVGFQGNFINSLYPQLPSTITVGLGLQSVAFNPSGTLAYVANHGSYTVSVINPATNTVINTITVGTVPRSVAFNPSGTLAYITNAGSSTVSLINPATNSVINTITVGSYPYSVAFNPSGTLAYVANLFGHTVSVINPATNTVINTITVGSEPYSVAFNPSGTLEVEARH